MATIQEFLLKDVRCFQGEQRLQIRPLTLLVGKNSTGKSTVLSCFQTLFEYFKNNQLNFNLEPYNMGSFTDILCKKSKNKQFTLGFKFEEKNQTIEWQVTFTEKGLEPIASKLVIFFPEGEKLEIIPDDKLKDEPENFGNYFYDFQEIKKDYYRMFFSKKISNVGLILYSLKYIERGNKKTPPPFLKFLKKNKNILENMSFNFFDNNINIAPVRSKPKRTYDPLTQTQDPEGADVTMYLANLSRSYLKEWKRLQEKLNVFGKEAGLFDVINIKESKDLGNAFQIQFKTKGMRANIMDVGYGVSQLLPVLVRILSFKGKFLMQQPEVHLHPQGQAAFASLLTNLVKENKSFLLETHSDYIIDRVRLEIRKKNISNKDVSLVFHEPQKDGVKINNVTFDDYANFENLPAAYRDFFLAETNSLLGFNE